MKKEKKIGPYEFSDGKIIRRKEEAAPVTPGRRFLESLVDEEDEADNAQALENAKTNFDKRKIRDTTVRIAIVGAMLTVLFASFLTFGFKLKNIDVSGMTVYSAEEIENWINENASENVLFASSSALADELRVQFPKLRNITVKKDLPNTISITAEDDVPAYYIMLDEEYYILSDELKVMLRTDDGDSASGLLLLDTDGIKKAVTGEKLQFRYDYQYDYIKELLDDITTHEMSYGVVSVDADNKFDISVNYDDRFTIKIGAGENVKTKLTLAQAYIESLPEGETGIIDSTSTEKGSYISLMK